MFIFENNLSSDIFFGYKYKNNSNYTMKKKRKISLSVIKLFNKMQLFFQILLILSHRSIFMLFVP